MRLPADPRERRLDQLVRMLRKPVVLDDGRTIDVAAQSAPRRFGQRGPLPRIRQGPAL
ncbi:hypothetical protein [Streptomyces sp. NBC_00207]|uniref:hypothetical protein n=1 Tax=Streptomyces sp. NBC_00207 TaxID=2903635 RepID=UPI0032520119